MHGLPVPRYAVAYGWCTLTLLQAMVKVDVTRAERKCNQGIRSTAYHKTQAGARMDQ